MKKTLSTVLLALLGFASSATAQVQANYNDLILGFRATGGQGQNINLEVNLGSVALYTNPASSPMTVTRLAAADLSGTYGATWKTRTDLFWGIIGTAGRISTGPTRPQHFGRRSHRSPSERNRRRGRRAAATARPTLPLASRPSSSVPPAA